MEIKDNLVTMKFIYHELAIELGLPPKMLKDITRRVFRKIQKHMMLGRSVKIPDFGLFFHKFNKPKLTHHIAKQSQEWTPPTFTPRFKFRARVRKRIRASQLEYAKIYLQKMEGTL